MENFSIGQFAKEVGVTVQTLRNWDKSGKLKPHHVSLTGHRSYSQQQLDYYLSLQGLSKSNLNEDISYLPQDRRRQQEAVEDFIQIANVFARRMSRNDSKVIEKMLNKLKEGDSIMEGEDINE